MVAATGGRKETHTVSRCTTSKTRLSARSCPTASTMSAPTPAGSISASRATRPRYASMQELRITADCGGSNGARVRLWKTELQKLADATGITLHVNHYPPGTSKWNKIEHRMFCHITQNWRGQPLDRTSFL